MGQERYPSNVAIGAFRYGDTVASTSDQWPGRLLTWFDPRHDFCHAARGLALPYTALTHAVRDEQ